MTGYAKGLGAGIATIATVALMAASAADAAFTDRAAGAEAVRVQSGATLSDSAKRVTGAGPSPVLVVAPRAAG